MTQDSITDNKGTTTKVKISDNGSSNWKETKEAFLYSGDVASASNAKNNGKAKVGSNQTTKVGPRPFREMILGDQAVKVENNKGNKNSTYMPKLSSRDTGILKSIFNFDAAGVAKNNFRHIEKLPEIETMFNTSNEIKVDVELPPDPNVTDLQLVEAFTDVEKDVINKIETSLQPVERVIINKPAAAWSGFPSLVEVHRRLEAQNNGNIPLLSPETEMDISVNAVYATERIVDDAILLQCEKTLREKIINTKAGKDYASAYTNLATIKKLILHHDVSVGKEISDKTLTSFEHVVALEKEIFDLLVKAVELAMPKEMVYENDNNGADNGADSLQGPRYIVSKRQANCLSSAYYQFASLLLTKAAKIEKYLSHRPGCSSSGFLFSQKELLESRASNYFFISGAFGNRIAADLSGKVNPYAKLCGNMVKQSIIEQFKAIE